LHASHVDGSPIYTWAYSRAGPGQGKARHRKWRPRPGPARLSGLTFLPKPGPRGVFFVGPSGFRAGPSQKRPKIVPRPGPSQLSGHVFATQARPSGRKMRPRPEIFGPGRAGLVGPGFPCPGIPRKEETSLYRTCASLGGAATCGVGSDHGKEMASTTTSSTFC
jgi:hypothetical protein